MYFKQIEQKNRMRKNNKLREYKKKKRIKENDVRKRVK